MSQGTVSRQEVREWPAEAMVAARCLVGGKVVGGHGSAWSWIKGLISADELDADQVEACSSTRTSGQWVRVTEARDTRFSHAEYAALALIGCPKGGWPETQQARREFSDVAGAYREIDGKQVWCESDPIETARHALKRGAERPARAAEWGL